MMAFIQKWKQLAAPVYTSGQEPAGPSDEVTKHLNDEVLPLRFYQTLGFFSVWHEVSKQKGISTLIVLSAISALLSGPFVLSAYLGFAINNIIYTKNMDLLFSLSVVVFVLIFLGGIAEFYTNKIAAQTNSRICHQLVSRSWYQLITMPSITFGQLKQSELTSVLMDTMETLQKHQLFVIQNTLRSLFVVAFTVVILSYYHITFLFLVSFFVVITCAVPIYVAKGAQTYIQQEPSRLAAVNGFVSSVLGLQLFLRFSNLTGLTNKFKQLLLDLSITQAGKWLIWNFSFNLKVTLNLLSHVCMLWLGGLLFLRSSIDLTELVVVYVLTSMVIPRLDNIYKIYNYSQSLTVCYEKLKPFSNDDVPVPAQKKQKIDYRNIQSLRLNQVSFRYPLANELAISDLDLTFEQGKSYQISGDSGVGKSTLIDLLSGIIHPTSGYFEVNGNPLSLDCVKSFWQRIVVHEQANIVLKQHSVMDNIILFGDELNKQRFEKACDLLHFTHCINKAVSELSGGELQRLCFIRNYARNADVYIFDEPTAALDGGFEQQVFTLLGELKHSIVIVVSHNQNIRHYFDFTVHLDKHSVITTSVKETKS